MNVVKISLQEANSSTIPTHPFLANICPLPASSEIQDSQLQSTYSVFILMKRNSDRNSALPDLCLYKQ